MWSILKSQTCQHKRCISLSGCQTSRNPQFSQVLSSIPNRCCSGREFRLIQWKLVSWTPRILKFNFYNWSHQTYVYYMSYRMKFGANCHHLTHFVVSLHRHVLPARHSSTVCSCFPSPFPWSQVREAPPTWWQTESPLLAQTLQSLCCDGCVGVWHCSVSLLLISVHASGQWQVHMMFGMQKYWKIADINFPHELLIATQAIINQFFKQETYVQHVFKFFLHFWVVIHKFRNLDNLNFSFMVPWNAN